MIAGCDLYRSTGKLRGATGLLSCSLRAAVGDLCEILVPHRPPLLAEVSLPSTQMLVEDAKMRFYDFGRAPRDWDFVKRQLMFFAFGLVAFGFLCMGPVNIAVDSYGPVTDNAQSVFELAQTESKPGIKEEMAKLRTMGIKTIMCTGDNKLTAATIRARSASDLRAARLLRTA